MSLFRWLRTLLLIFVLLSCGQPLPTLDEMDLQAWKEDKLACEGKRASMLSPLDAQKEKLIGLSEQEIMSMLGKPDENELYKRNQKFYYYFVQPSRSCGPTVAINAKKLVIRFNATGLAKEVGVE